MKPLSYSSHFRLSVQNVKSEIGLININKEFN
jgi:hypothetical protein